MIAQHHHLTIMPILGKDHPCCLAIPELLRLIFAHMDDDDNARNAQVCKTWSDIALDCLWHSPDSVYRIFNALSPLSMYGYPKVYNFSHTPSVQNWEQFQKYSSRLKSLEYGSNSTDEAISREVLHTVAQTRPILHVFPNSKQLIWRPQNILRRADLIWKDTDARLFMHSGIESFQFRLLSQPEITSDISRARFVADVPCRMPNLTHIEIITELPPGVLDNELCKLISELQQLKSVTLPVCHLSAPLFEVLSKLPSLEKLDYEYADPSVPVMRHTSSLLTPLVPIDIHHGFDSLHHLEVLCGYGDGCALVRHTPQLKRLYLASKYAWETVESLQTLLEVASDQCPNLLELNVASMRGRQPLRSRFTQMSGLECGGIPPITFQTLQPLTRMHALVELDIEDTTSLAMSLSDIETFLSSLPQLKTLHLNHSPLRLNNAPFGLDILPAVGRHCKNLEEFSTFFDATRPIPTFPAEQGGSILPALIRLCISVSIITRQVISDVAIYLSRILPRTCDLVMIHPEWPDKTDDYDEEDDLKVLESITNQRLNIWHEVRNMIPPLRQLQIEERVKAENAAEEVIQPLKREIQELRELTGRLESKTPGHLT